jgi:hypothetical protein
VNREQALVRLELNVTVGGVCGTASSPSTATSARSRSPVLIEFDGAPPLRRSFEALEDVLVAAAGRFLEVCRDHSGRRTSRRYRRRRAVGARRGIS